MRMEVWISVLLTTTALFCGCLDVFSNEVFIDITTENHLNYDVRVIVEMNNKEIYNEYESGSGEGQPIGVTSTGDLYNKGKKDFRIKVLLLNDELLYSNESSYNVQRDVEIYISILPNGLHIKFQENDYDDPPENNEIPILRNGGYELLDNGSYLFHVEYLDEDGGIPKDSFVTIAREVPFGWKDTTIEYTQYLMFYDPNIETDGENMYFHAIINNFEEGDEYYFAFSDGYDIARSEDDTPSTDP